jgi:hypothetical protein
MQPLERTVVRLEFIPHLMRARNDKKSCFPTFYRGINLDFHKFIEHARQTRFPVALLFCTSALLKI